MVHENYRYFESAQELRDRAAADPEFALSLKKRLDKAEYMMSHFHDSTELVCGWHHNFTCPKCGTYLTFDPEMPYKAGENIYTCPRCGEKVSGTAFDGGWVFEFRYLYSHMLADVAVAALLGNEKALRFVIDFVDLYADLYPSFPDHRCFAGRGHITAQSLDEAVWTLAVLDALTILTGSIPKAKMEDWYTRLFAPTAELLIRQTSQIHNIHTWHMCAVGAIGICFDKPELLDLALNSEFGIRNQVAKGYTSDAIWYEGSLGYHFYTTDSLANFLRFYALVAPNDPLFDTFERMFTSVQALCYDGNTLPVLNDMERENFLTQRGELLDKILRVCDSEKLRFVRKGILPPDIPDRILFAGTNLAVFHKPMNALIKSGSLCRSHMHQDLLSLTLPPIADETGTTGYGNELSLHFYRTVCAHNAVAVDGASPADVVKTRVEEVEGGFRAVLCDTAWKNVLSAERVVTVDGNGLCDVTSFRTDGVHTMDWFFHGREEAEYSCSGTPVASLDGGDGYQYITDLKRMDCGSEFSARFPLDGKTLIVKLALTEGMEVYTGKTPFNPADISRATIIVRMKSDSAVFRASYREE